MDLLEAFHELNKLTEDVDRHAEAKQIKKDVLYDIENHSEEGYTEDNYYYAIGQEMAARDFPFLPNYFLDDSVGEEDKPYQDLKQGYLDNGGVVESLTESAISNLLDDVEYALYKAGYMDNESIQLSIWEHDTNEVAIIDELNDDFPRINTVMAVLKEKGFNVRKEFFNNQSNGLIVY